MQHPEVEDDAWIYDGQQRVPPTVRRVKIADTVTKIPTSGAFHKHPKLEEVILSSSVQVIGESAFFGCEKLKCILYQGLEKEEVLGIPPNVKLIDFCAFNRCKLLARLVLNEGLEKIGMSAFTYCESLTEVEIPSTVKDIPTYAFNACTSLVRLGLNEGLETIGLGAFSGCCLSHIRIPRSVISVATNAFSGCSRLISIELPELPEERSFEIDLSGCQSLVSLAGPLSLFFPKVFHQEEFFRSSKFGSLVDNKTDLRRRFKHRFDNSPLNKLCYYQSYQSLDDAMARVHSLMEGGPPLAATTEVDEFGMTPLHILSLSQTPNLDMLLVVMDAGRPGHMVRVVDSFGCTPMDYLVLNRMPNSSEVIRRLLQTRFEQVLGGLDKFWKPVMLQAIDKILAGDWASRKSEVDRVIRKFEWKEVLSLLELCLWKMKNDEGTSNKKVKIGEATSKKEQILADRQRCRVMSGVAVVIPHVLPFF